MNKKETIPNDLKIRIQLLLTFSNRNLLEENFKYRSFFLKFTKILNTINKGEKMFKIFIFGIIILSINRLNSEDFLIYSQSFNKLTKFIEIKNGAQLGTNGSGVSGKPSDKAYIAKVNNTSESEQGPVGIIKQDINVEALEEITLTLWYQAENIQIDAATILDAASLVLIRDNNGWTLRISADTDQKMYWFKTGKNAPYHDWLEPKQWIFIACAWSMKKNEVIFYQGTKDNPVKIAKVSTRNDEVKGLIQRKNKEKFPDAIGNTFNAKYNRPFNGFIDNVKIFSKALDQNLIEQIRQDDINNITSIIKMEKK